MDLLDRLLGHDAWTTKQILDICKGLSDEALDAEFEIGHCSLRKTLDHIIYNMETWSCLMADLPTERATDCSIDGLTNRLDIAAERLSSVARRTAESDAWDETWKDHLDDPPQEKRFGTAIAHVLTHSMHHRAQLLYLLRLTGIKDLPEGDVFSWEEATRPLA